MAEQTEPGVTFMKYQRPAHTASEVGAIATGLQVLEEMLPLVAEGGAVMACGGLHKAAKMLYAFRERLLREECNREHEELTAALKSQYDDGFRAGVEVGTEKTLQQIHFEKAQKSAKGAKRVRKQ